MKAKMYLSLIAVLILLTSCVYNKPGLADTAESTTYSEPYHTEISETENSTTHIETYTGFVKATAVTVISWSEEQNIYANYKSKDLPYKIGFDVHSSYVAYSDPSYIDPTLDYVDAQTGALNFTLSGVYELNAPYLFGNDFHSYTREGKETSANSDNAGGYSGYTVDKYDEIISGINKNGCEYVVYKSNTLRNFAYVKLDDQYVIGFHCSDTDKLMFTIESVQTLS